MTDFEKIEAEISSVLEEYKQRVPTKSVNNPNTKPDKIIISTSDFIMSPKQITTDLTNKMDYIKGIHIIKHGNENEDDIDKLIKSSLQSFAEYRNAIDL